MSSNALQRTMKSQLIQSHYLTSHLVMENHMEKFLECFLIRRLQTMRPNLLTKQMTLNREQNVSVCIQTHYSSKSQYLVNTCNETAIVMLYIFHILLHSPSLNTSEADLFLVHIDGMHFFINFFQKCKGFL